MTQKESLISELAKLTKTKYEELKENDKFIKAQSEYIEQLKTRINEKDEIVYKDDFTAGIVHALAHIVKEFHKPGMANSILDKIGVDISKAYECDVAVLRANNPSLPIGKE